MIIILLVLTVIQQQNKQSFWLSHTNIMSGERKVLGWLYTWIPACCIKVEELVHGQSHLWNTLPEGLVPRLQQCSVSRAICGTPYLRVWVQDYNSACEPGHLWNALPEGLVPRLQQCGVSQASCQVARYIAIKCAMDTSLLLCM